MHRSYPSALRIEQRRQFRRRLAAGTSALIAACALAFATAADPLPAEAELTPVPAAASPPAPTVPVAAPARRPVYRYSVIPGGAVDAAELARILRTDKVAAAHYAGFDVAKARPVTVSTPRAVYVSYRKGGQIYWTAKKVMLQAGETLLTDGRSEMRARCANRISDVPRLPVEKHAPSPEALDMLEGEGSLAFVGTPDLDAIGDLPESAGQRYQLMWPPADEPPAVDEPGRPRTPFADQPPPGLPWPQRAWPPSAGLPPQSGAVPEPPLLAFGAPPSLVALPGDPDPSDPIDPASPSDPRPFVPQPDPGRPAPPPNPLLDDPHPANVSEPATPWLAAAALGAMLGLRRKKRRPRG